MKSKPTWRLDKLFPKGRCFAYAKQRPWLSKRLFFKQQLVRVGKKLCLSTILFFGIPTALVKAQITPDGSLSTSVQQEENTLNINGGEREGNNLFHSFEEFSVPEGIEAVFENASDIENIFTRITGESASAINGILKTQGVANFFLVNPNGIIFGKNAQLDVGGSFIATAANSIQFEDGAELTAKNAEEKPILTVSVPIGLNFDSNSGAIQVNGVGHQIINDSPFSPIEFGEKLTGLSVPNDRTFALIGNGLNFNSGIVTNKGGQIYLGSINTGSVAIEQTETGLVLLDNVTNKYQDIDLGEQSLINFSGEEVGTITLLGQNINITGDSFVLSQNQGNSSESLINIKSSETLTISDISPNGNAASYIRSETFSNGTGASINISANQLFLEGGRIQTNTSSNAMAGNINIEVSNIAKFDRGFVIAPTFSKGDAGNINLSTSQLRLTNSGLIVASTLGKGNAGQVTVEADSIDVIGSSVAQDNSTISAASFGTGNAGTVTVNTKQLRVIDGGIISSSSFGTGSAGILTIDASEFVQVIGANDQLESSRISTFVESASVLIRRVSGLPEITTGNSGNLIINTPSLNVSQGGIISVENQGTGNGGTLLINAEQLNLEEAGRITAATDSGIGGNINLDTENLQIDTDSSITATAGNNGDGGNVTIKTTSLIAKKNSQVTANAFGGRGGNINIDAEGVFLFDSPSNIFSASSELGIDGEIQINTPDINFQKELEQSELEILTAEQAISNSCLARSNQPASLTVRSNDGLPKNSNSNYSDTNFSLSGVGSLPAISEKAVPTQKNQNQALIPAEKIVATADGRIFLVTAPRKASSLFCQKN
jgi:filamentous hemagglutinin family protein